MRGWKGLWILFALLLIVSGFLLFPANTGRISLAGQLMLNAKQSALAMVMYTSDYDERFPSLERGSAVAGRLGPYCGNERLSRAIASYVWNLNLSRRTASSVLRPSQVWMFHSAAPTSAGHYQLCYVDGDCDSVTGAELKNIEDRPIGWEDRSRVRKGSGSK